MNGVLIDANLLVMLVVGLADRALIERHKRTRQFEPADFDLLVELLSKFQVVVVTPHVLAETSNLASQIGEPALARVRAAFAKIAPTQDEQHVPASSAVESPEFIRLGLTDAALLELARKGLTLLTVDTGLYLAGAAVNPQTTNFNHLREARLLGLVQ